jgi:hypothetical protein
MANPNPILVTPSTTIVQVNPLLSPYTPVLLNAYSYTGQVVTIQDGTSSFGVLQTPIVVSTVSQFSDGSLSTLINQPQGTITAQAGLTSWSILNSFPFRNQYLSAGVQNLNVSTLFTSSLSTLQEFTSTLFVENLFVSGNFSQGSGLILNQTISSLGNVNLFSSVTVWQSTFFSSALSTLGKVTFASSLTIHDNFIISSSVLLLSSGIVNSGSVLDYLSTGSIRLGSALDTYKLIITTSGDQSIDIGNHVFVSNRLQVGSTFNAGGNYTSYRTNVGALSTLSTMAVAGNVYVLSSATIHGGLSTFSGIGVLQNLSVGGEVVLQGNLEADSLVGLGSQFFQGLVSTGNLFAESLSVRGNAQVNVSTPTSIQNLAIQTAFGLGSLLSFSTSIGGTLSTPALVYGEGIFQSHSSLFVRESIRTLSSFSTLGDFYTLTSLSTLENVQVSTAVRIDGNFTTSTLYWNQLNISSSYIAQDLSILGNLTVTQTMKLSSITLVSSVLANSFETSTLAAGYLGIVSSVAVSSLRASSIGTGGIQYPSFTMDMSNDFQTINLSTLLLSSLQFFAQSEGTFAQNTFFEARSSFGVNTIASTNTFDINTIAYTLCNTSVLQRLSSGAIFGDSISGILSGDGRLLSNVGYPAGVSTLFVETSSLKAQKIHTDVLFLSTMIADRFTVNSSFTVGQFGFYGDLTLPNLLDNPLSNELHVAAPKDIPNLLFLNTLSIYGDSTDTVTKRVVLNSNTYTIPTRTEPYTFAADSLRVSTINSSNFSFPMDRIQGDILYVNGLTTNSLYVSSSRIGLSPGCFFLPEDETVQLRSTNTIQTYQSTLIFNSTLFVNLPLSSVGVNTFPFYKLDVHSVAYAPNGVEIYQSTFVSNKVIVNTTQQNAASMAVGPSTLQTNGSATFYSQVQFFNAPQDSFVNSLATPNIAYSNSGLQLNRTLALNNLNNVTVAYTNNTSAYTSTLFVGGSTFVSGFVSTNRLLFQNGFHLSMQFV